MFENIGTLFLQAIIIQCKCLGCSGVFSITCKLLSLKHRLLRLFSPCPKCKREIKLVVRYEIMHKENMSHCATLASQNLNLIELKGVVYAFTCSECDNSYIQKQSALQQVIHHNCESCFRKMNLEFFAHTINPIMPTV